MEAAVDDDIIQKSKCRIRDAGKEEADERLVATVEQVIDLADVTGLRWQLMILLDMPGGAGGAAMQGRRLGRGVGPGQVRRARADHGSHMPPHTRLPGHLGTPRGALGRAARLSRDRWRRKAPAPGLTNELSTLRQTGLIHPRSLSCRRAWSRLAHR